MLEYRNTQREKARIADLIKLFPSEGIENALDIGARDGFFSMLLAERYSRVTALDLDKPDIRHNKIECVQGNVIALDFNNESYDLVFCAEVLEHIPSTKLQTACSEISRISRQYLIIGVPYKQDIRMGRTTCYTCGQKNPPWGHVNVFDEKRLQELFPDYEPLEWSYVGVAEAGTNTISRLLMDWAGNPYGTYAQDEPCIYCANPLVYPPKRNFLQKISTKLASTIQRGQKLFLKPHPNWIHVLFKKTRI